MIDTQLTPLFAGIWAEIGSALVVIFIGIWAETCGVNKKSVGANVLGLFLMLVTAGIDLVVLPLLVFYLIIGLRVYSKKWRRLYFFFSSKTYGCLMLGIALLHTQRMQNFLELTIHPSLESFNSAANLVLVSTLFVTLYWFAAVPFAYLLGYIVKKRSSR